MSWSEIGNIFGGSAASSAGGSLPWEGMSYSMEDYSPSMKVFGNFFTNQYDAQAKRQNASDQRVMARQLELERSSFQQRMSMAKEQGLHPLSVLGVPMSSVSLQSAPGPSVPGSGSGVSLSRDVGKHQGPSEYDQKMMEYNERIASANARNAEANAARNELELMRDSSVATGRPGAVSNDAQVLRQSSLSGVPASQIRRKGSSSFAGSSDTTLIEIQPDQVKASSPKDAGFAAGVPPGMRRVAIPGGKTMLVPDQDVIQSDIDEGALFNALLNHGVSPDAAMDIIGFGPYLLGAIGGVGMAASRIHRGIKAAKAARLLQQHKARRAWKGGE